MSFLVKLYKRKGEIKSAFIWGQVNFLFRLLGKMKCLVLKTSNIKFCLFFKISQNVYGNILINDRVNLFSPYFTEFLHAVVVSYVKYPCYWERLNWYMQLCVRIFLPPDLSSSYFNSSIPAIRSLYNHKRKKKSLI